MSDIFCIVFLVSSIEFVQQVLVLMLVCYGVCLFEEVDVLCLLGGDGFLLQILYCYGVLGKLVFGMKLGIVGFLMNQFCDDDLLVWLVVVELVNLCLLEMLVLIELGMIIGLLVYNDVFLLCQICQVVYIGIDFNGQEWVVELIGDGVLVVILVGSIVYNYFVYGLILLLGLYIIVLMLLVFYCLWCWCGVIFKVDIEVCFCVFDFYKCLVSVIVDLYEICDVVEVIICELCECWVMMLFDFEYNLEDWIFSEQFMF